MANFEGIECPECRRGTVKVVQSNSGGWFYGCTRFDWNAYNHGCKAAWRQNGTAYRGTNQTLHAYQYQPANQAQPHKSFWRTLFGG